MKAERERRGEAGYWTESDPKEIRAQSAVGRIRWILSRMRICSGPGSQTILGHFPVIPPNTQMKWLKNNFVTKRAFGASSCFNIDDKFCPNFRSLNLKLTTIPLPRVSGNPAQEKVPKSE